MWKCLRMSGVALEYLRVVRSYMTVVRTAVLYGLAMVTLRNIQEAELELSKEDGCDHVLEITPEGFWVCPWHSTDT